MKLSSLKKQYPQLETVFVESFSFPLNENSQVTVSAQTPYQWTLLSNSVQPLVFFGTFEQLLNQQFVFENFVDGSCDGFSTRDLNMELMNRGIVFFSEECQRPAYVPTKKSWASENRHWLYVAGAVVLGGVIYSMKDKKMIIDTSAFK